ncbi:MAG: trk/ktr system potassium uptake protein [Actinomycetota bacterium]|nr:trk/ktr system potassium uptake protein [Actinomycetota bacterium]
MGGRSPDTDNVLICGLGRFGASTALTLTKMGRSVLAVDRDPHLVQQWAGRLTRVVEADTTDAEVLEELGCSEFPVAVVSIGTSVESSVLTAAALVDLGIGQIWAKALTIPHGKILERIGVGHVIYPEADAGRRVAHLVGGRLMDYIEFDDGFAIVKMRPPLETQGFTLAESHVRKKYGVTIVGVKSPYQDFTYAQPDTRVSQHDILIVSGRTELLERFAARP